MEKNDRGFTARYSLEILSLSVRDVDPHAEIHGLVVARPIHVIDGGITCIGFRNSNPASDHSTAIVELDVVAVNANMSRQTRLT